MNRTIIIILGIACALVTAAGIIYYTPINVARRQLYDKDPVVKMDAMLTLYELGDRASFPRIRQLYHSDDFEVSRMAAAFLAEVGDEESRLELINLIDNKDMILRSVAITALQKMGDRESILKIRECLSDESEVVRYKAIESLIKIDDKESSLVIRKSLYDKKHMVRFISTRAMVTFGDEESIPLIKELLNDENEWMREKAAQALKDLGVPEDEIEDAKESTKEIIEAEKFSAIEDFYRKNFPDTTFSSQSVSFTDGPSDKRWFHILVPRKIDLLFFYPYSEDFLRKQLEGDDTLRKMIADDLLQLRHGILHKSDKTSFSYDGGKHYIRCTDYYTPLKYYLLDHPRKESILDIKQLIRDEDKNVREKAAQALKDLGVTDSEIKEAKEKK